MTPPSPRVVLGMPIYNSADHLPEAIESLLSQTYRDFQLVLVDDRSSDGAGAVVERYWARDGRILYHLNNERLGLTRNWRRAFDLAMEACPEAELFAWVSDHDVWHPRWLAALMATLDARADASVAFSDSAVISKHGGLDLRSPSIDTSDLGSFGSRIRQLSRRLRAGHTIYGLCRVEALRRVGVFRHVLYADRLALVELAFYGALVRVPEMLWYKRPTGSFTVARQRLACFPDGVPPYGRLPWWVQHAGVLAWNLGVRGRGRPLISRGDGLTVSAVYAWWNGGFAFANRWRWYRKARKKWRARHSDTAVKPPPPTAQGKLKWVAERGRAEVKLLEELIRY